MRATLPPKWISQYERKFQPLMTWVLDTESQMHISLGIPSTNNAIMPSSTDFLVCNRSNCLPLDAIMASSTDSLVCNHSNCISLDKVHRLSSIQEAPDWKNNNLYRMVFILQPAVLKHSLKYAIITLCRRWKTEPIIQYVGNASIR